MSEESTDIKSTKKNRSALLLTVVLLLGIASAGGLLYYKKHYIDANTTDPALNSAEIRALEENVHKNPTSLEAWIALANAYYDNNAVKKAIVAYEKALELSNNNPSPAVLTDYATMLRQDGQFEAALKNYNTALQIAPTHPVAQYNKGLLLYYNLQDKEQALTCWKEVLAAYPNALTPDGQKLADAVEALFPEGKNLADTK